MPEQKIAASDERTRDFLDVEAQARALVERLARLDEETSRYAAAATQLDQAAQATRDLVASVQTVGAEVTKGIEVVSSVGGPGIVKRLGELEAAQAESAEVIIQKVNSEIVIRLGELEAAQAARAEAIIQKVNYALYAAAGAAGLALVAVLVSLIR